MRLSYPHWTHYQLRLGCGDNTLTTQTLVTFEELSSKPHVPERILDVKTKKKRSKIIREFKIKWMDKSIKDATWERKNTLRTNFPDFPLQECNVLKREGLLLNKSVKKGRITFNRRD